MPEWPVLFPPPWNQKHTNLHGFYPYRIRKISLAELNQRDNSKDTTHSYLEPTASHRKDIDDYHTIDQDKVWSPHWHNADDTLFTSYGGLNGASSILVRKESPNFKQPKTDLSSKTFTVHSDYLKRHLDPWAIGSYQPEEEKSSTYHNKTGIDESEIASSPWTSHTTRKQFETLQNHEHPKEGGPSQAAPPRVSTFSSPAVESGPETTSDKDDHNWIFLPTTEDESSEKPFQENAEDLNDSSVSQKRVSENRKANKRAYHQRRRREKAAAAQT
jgi:hypothetical protein